MMTWRDGAIWIAIAVLIWQFFADWALPAEEKWVGEWMWVKTTMYCAGPCDACGTDGDKTKSGRSARRDGVATDPAVIPTGCRVDVPGVDLGPNGNGSWLPADDTGGRVEGAHVDIRSQKGHSDKRWT